MSSVAFIDQVLQNFYNTGVSSSFRNNLTTAQKEELAALESRIASFEQAIIEPLPSGQNTYDYPYDAEGLKREFLDEVLAFLIKTGYNGYYDAKVTVNLKIGDTITTSTSHNLYGTNDTDIVNFLNNQYPGWTYTYSVQKTNNMALKESVYSFDALSEAEKKALLTQQGQSIYQYYSDLIDKVFAEGRELIKDPADIGTDENGAALNDTANVNIVTAIPAREIVIGNDTITFDHVTTLRHNFQSPNTLSGNTLTVRYDDGSTQQFTVTADDIAAGYYLATYIIEEDLETYTVLKKDLKNTAGTKVDFQLTFTDQSTKNTRYIAVDPTSLEPLNDPPVAHVQYAQRHLYATEYLYYWNEARNHILRGQLLYKEAVTREMQEDLRQANAVLSELEGLAGQTRAQSNPDDDGNTTMNPDTTRETLEMDLWEAMSSKPGDQILPGYGDGSGGADDLNNYTEWAKNRTNLKNWIDRKSAQSQQAMLDYQTVLNRYNNAYEVFAKLQDKLQGLMSSMFRHIGG